MKGVYSQAFFVKKQQKPGRHSRGTRVFSEMDGRQGGAQGGDQPINIYIGEELLDSVIANSQNRRALRSGGR